MMYERLSSLSGPPCAHMIDNCLWKEAAQPVLDMANDNLSQMERFLEENDVEEMFRSRVEEWNLEQYDMDFEMIEEMLASKDENLQITRDELNMVQNWVNEQKECIAPTEIYGAIDWAMDQLDIDCSNATTVVMGASTLFVASFAF